MAQPSEIIRLCERRRLLVARSSDLRSQFARDFSDLQSSTIWVERGYSWLRSGRALWPLLAGAAGFALAYRKGGWIGVAQKLVSAFQLARNAGGVIKAWLEHSSGK